VHIIVATRVSSLFACSIARVASLSILLIALLSGCASSNVSRNAASNMDKGVDSAQKAGNNFMDGDIVESYQNTSQATKGAMFGGAAGALVGAAASSTVGVVPGAIAGGLLGASFGAYIDSQSTLSDQLTNRGVTMVELGDQILIVLPSARLFNGMTAKFKPQAYSTLNLLTMYINSYTKTLVKISAYTDDMGERRVNLALSKQQARAVERYLASNGTNARLLYSDGFGGTNLVMRNTMDWGNSDNYRIEITMEKLDA
jgi:outer membrane protein OmpA-like peptidoglycan-associated protein